jgi:hypothetical protein
MTQLAALLVMGDEDAATPPASIDPVSVLPERFKSTVKEDTTFTELRRICLSNMQRKRIGRDLVLPPEHMVIWGDMGLPWVVLADRRFTAVLLLNARAFRVLFVPGPLR